jgi:hypothetical protein
VRGQQVAPLFSAKLVRWSEHPVLSKPPVIRATSPSSEAEFDRRELISSTASLSRGERQSVLVRGT